MKQLTILALLFLLLTGFSCETEEPIPTFILYTKVSPIEAGEITLSPTSARYNEGESVTVNAEANPNWVFQKWEGDEDGDSNPLTLSMDSDKSLNAIFVKRNYPLTIIIEGEGTVNEVIIANPGGREYPHGTTVELTPVPQPGWTFNKWGGDLSGTEVPKRISVDGQKNVTVTFTRNNYPLNLIIEGEGTVNEVIVTNPGGKEYPYSTNVELTPIPNEGWVFDSWGGDLNGSEVPKRITVSGEKNVTAKFKRKDYPLTVIVEGEGRVNEVIVSNPGGKEYPHGTNVELTPVPNEGWVFDSWGGDLVGTGIPQRIFVDGAKNVIAKFTKVSLFYLAENGITCKCEKAQSGERGFINGVEYEAVDNDRLRQKRDEGADMTKLCTSLVTSMTDLFKNTNFNQPIGNWDVSHVTEMAYMFAHSQFNQPIGNWDVSNVRDMTYLFTSSPFNQPIGNWDVGNVLGMTEMFADTPFNQLLGAWNVSKVRIMIRMFAETVFNQEISDWDVGDAQAMRGMFANSKFNKPIGDWDVSNVQTMGQMFQGSVFNQPIGDWNMGKVFYMVDMFRDAVFNQPIGNWDFLRDGVLLDRMFMNNLAFNQDLSKWCVPTIKSSPYDFRFGANAWILPGPVWGTCPG